MPITPMEAFTLVAAEVGNAPSEQVAALIEERFGVRVNPKYIPLYRAMQRQAQAQAEARQAATSGPSPENQSQAA
jgi:hypothetical protein